MDKNIVIAVVLGALILIAGVQAYQLFTLKEKLSTGQLSAGAPVQGGSPQLPDNLQNLPSMVGGC